MPKHGKALRKASAKTRHWYEHNANSETSDSVKVEHTNAQPLVVTVAKNMFRHSS